MTRVAHGFISVRYPIVFFRLNLQYICTVEDAMLFLIT